MFKITTSAAMSSMHMLARRPIRFTPGPHIRKRRPADRFPQTKGFHDADAGEHRRPVMFGDEQ
jgi:hypothetical protein